METAGVSGWPQEKAATLPPAPPPSERGLGVLMSSYGQILPSRLSSQAAFNPRERISSSEASQPCEHHSPVNKLGGFGPAEPGDSLFQMTSYHGFSNSEG